MNNISSKNFLLLGSICSGKTTYAKKWLKMKLHKTSASYMVLTEVFPICKEWEDYDSKCIYYNTKSQNLIQAFEDKKITTKTFVILDDINLSDVQLFDLMKELISNPNVRLFVTIRWYYPLRGELNPELKGMAALKIAPEAKQRLLIHPNILNLFDEIGVTHIPQNNYTDLPLWYRSMYSESSLEEKIWRAKYNEEGFVVGRRKDIQD